MAKWLTNEEKDKELEVAAARERREMAEKEHKHLLPFVVYVLGWRFGPPSEAVRKQLDVMSPIQLVEVWEKAFEAKSLPELGLEDSPEARMYSMIETLCEEAREKGRRETLLDLVETKFGPLSKIVRKRLANWPADKLSE